MDRILVGVDGSEESQHALEWALEEAMLRGASLHLVHAYELPVIADPYALGLGIDWGAVEAQARDDAERRMAAIVERATVREGVEVTHEVVSSLQAAQALIQRTGEADLLVVGSRGRGGFAGLLLGSVSQQCVHHATCPVVVVR